MSDIYDLERFVRAQDQIYERALAEVRQGAKTSHWMWFIFPQLAGLGHSQMARRYAISGLDEARAYLDHEVLGSRLNEITEALLALPSMQADRIFGPIDAVKLRSCLTLFKHAGGGPLFQAGLKRWFDGSEDDETLRRL